MSSDSVCQKFQDLRKRLDQLKQSWDCPKTIQKHLGWSSFHTEWHEQWSRIVAMLGEIDQMLNRSRLRNLWDASLPAILPFPPGEDGVLSMGPF
jgi:hypothetical protein